MIRASGHAGALFLAAFCLAACATNTPNFTYEPGPAMSSAPAKYRAAVAFASNTSPEPKDTYNSRNFATCAEGDYYCPVSLAPERLTDVIARDLAASGLFISVVREGTGPADFVIRPAIREALQPSEVNWLLGLDLKVEKVGRVVLAKTYKRNWKTDDLRGDFYAFNQQKLAENLGGIMAEFRADLAAVLANEPVSAPPAPEPAPPPATTGPP